MLLLDNTPSLEPSAPHGGPAHHVLICAGNALAGVDGDGMRLLEISSELELGRETLAGSVHRFAARDSHMSRVHAKILRHHSDVMVIRDLDSRNGTYLDGVRISEERPLRDGAIIFMGAHVFVYRRMQPEALAAIKACSVKPFGPVATASAAMARLAGRLRRLAATNVEILLGGETGVGKEVLAMAIHEESRRKGDLVTINCAALPDGLVESELFGFEKGAHSTATSRKAGLIERAQGGTLFFDEVGEMSSSAQAKLLRFLQDRRYVSLGTTRSRELDVRIVAATSRSIADGEGAPGLRRDLAARLGPEPIVIPPLRSRLEDVGILVRYFLRDRPHLFDIHAYRSLFLNPWLGNVRELQKAVGIADALSGGPGSIRLDDMHVGAAALDQRDERFAGNGLSHAISRPTAVELRALLERHRGNVGSLAREIGRQRTLVWRWLRVAGLKPAEYRNADSDLPNA